jgi:large subunit ribosomal protein L25
MEKLIFKATKRTVTGKQVKQLRRSGELPAVIYGTHFAPTAISLEAHSTGLALPKLTGSSIINIELDGKLIPVLVRETQKNYVKNIYTHVDFLAVSLNEKITTSVTLHFHGLAPAIKNFSAAIVHNIDSIEVEALPNDLPEKIEVDLTKLAKLGDAIHVRDLDISKNVTILSDLDEMVAVASATHDEPVEGGAGSVEPEVIEKAKKEAA